MYVKTIMKLLSTTLRIIYNQKKLLMVVAGFVGMGALPNSFLLQSAPSC